MKKFIAIIITVIFIVAPSFSSVQALSKSKLKKITHSTRKKTSRKTSSKKIKTAVKGLKKSSHVVKRKVKRTAYTNSRGIPPSIFSDWLKESTLNSRSASIIKNVFNVSDIILYSTKYKEIAAVPVTYIVYNGGNTIPDYAVPKFAINQSAVTTEASITILNAVSAGNYNYQYNSLKRNLSISNDPLIKQVNVNISCADNAEINFYTVNKKVYSQKNITYYTTYIVAAFSQRDAESITTDQAIEVTSEGAVDLSNSSTSTTESGISLQNAQNNTTKTANPKNKILITIDPGHGGKDPGARGNGLRESRLNLDISNRVKNLLENEGYDVFMTRTNDTFVDLYNRADIGNILHSDLFLAIHNNANTSSRYSGTTVLYNSSSAKPQRALAEMMRDEISNSIGTKKLVTENRPYLVVLNSTSVPSVLAEIAVITNSSDAAKLKSNDYKQRAAEAIVRSIDKYFGF